MDNNSDFTQRVDWNQAPQRLLFLISFPGQWFLQVTRKSDGNLVNLLMRGTNEMRGHLGESKPTLARDGPKTCHVPTDPTIGVFCPGTTERPDPKGLVRMRVSCAVCVRDVSPCVMCLNMWYFAFLSSENAFAKTICGFSCLHHNFLTLSRFSDMLQ